MSRSFAARWSALRMDDLLSDAVLQARLSTAIKAPLVRRDGGVFLEPLLAHATGRESFQDTTGYEAFINKIHVEDLVEGPANTSDEQMRVLVVQGVKAAIELSEKLKKEGAFRVLLSLDPDVPTLTLRFFGRREGENWGPDDPDTVELEELLMIDSDPPESSKDQDGRRRVKVSEHKLS